MVDIGYWPDRVVIQFWLVQETLIFCVVRAAFLWTRVKLTSHLLVQRLRTSGAIPSLSHVLSWHVQGLVGLYMLSTFEMKISQFCSSFFRKVLQKIGNWHKIYTWWKSVTCIWNSLYAEFLYEILGPVIRFSLWSKKRGSYVGLHLPFCGLVSAGKPLLGFPWNSVMYFFTKIVEQAWFSWKYSQPYFTCGHKWTSTRTFHISSPTEVQMSTYCDLAVLGCSMEAILFTFLPALSIFIVPFEQNLHILLVHPFWGMLFSSWHK